MFTARRTERSQPRAFTLIELLVVVAIIALLLAILLPALSRARAQARMSLGLSNMRQGSVAMRTYATEHDGEIPRGGSPNDQNHWAIVTAKSMGLLKRLTKGMTNNELRVDNMEVFQCPEQRQVNGKPWISYVVNAFDPEGYTGTWNPMEQAPPGEPQKALPKLSSYKRHGDVVYLLDAEVFSKSIDAYGYVGTKTAYDNWKHTYDNNMWETNKQQAINYIQTKGGGLDVMDMWMGAHLPQSRTVNRDETPGPRRAGRRVHIKQFTNAVFLDGHGESLRLTDTGTPEEQYMDWLRRMGIKPGALATTAAAPESP